MINKNEEYNTLLNDYYNRRSGIENSFAFRYNGQVEIRVKNLTKKYVKLIEKIKKDE